MPAARPTSRLAILWLLLAAIPPITIAAAIAMFSVNVPYLYDDFSTGQWIADVRNHGLSMHLLFTQFNEARPVIPHLIQYSLAHFTGWDQRYLMSLSLLLAISTAACIFALARKTHGATSRTSATFALASLFIFSLLQCPNWLWGHQIVVFIPNLCLIAALLITRTSLRPFTRAALCALICATAELSFPNGLLLWPIIFIALFTIPGQSRTDRRSIAITWCLLSLIAISAYFIGYHHPDNFPTLAEALSDPLRAAKFFLIFLGMPLGWGFDNSPELACLLAGGTLLIAFTGITLYILKHRRSLDVLHRTLAWLLLAAYVLLSAAIATAGRAATPELAFHGRYVTFSAYLPISLFFLVTALPKRLPFLPSAIAVVALLLTQCLIIPPALTQMKTMRTTRLQAKAGLELVAILGDRRSVLNKIDPYSPGQHDRTLYLDDAGLFHPRVIRSKRVNDFAAPTAANGQASFDRDPAEVTATGSAFLTTRPADAVVLSADSPDGSSTAIDFTDEISNEGHFEIHCALSKIPPGAVSFSAWAFDAKTATAYRIPSSR